MYEFEQEIRKFYSAFEKFIDKKIVLYGIGRKTAVLVDNNHVFNFVGLMDRDPKNVGSIRYGLPVLTVEEAEKQADLIIINAPETYWEVIYQRISNCAIPVYFLNGEKAQLHSVNRNQDLEYWRFSISDLKTEIEKHEVISFDVFDTLVSRKIVRPSDVFDLLDKEFHENDFLEKDRSYPEIRNKVLGMMDNENFKLRELYEKMAELGYVSKNVIDALVQLEFEMEKKLLVPRTEMINLCKELVERKTLFLVTDMYYSAEQIQELLKLFGLFIPIENIWVSCEHNANKREGGLWEQYKDVVVEEKTALHIGDNKQSDILNPQAYGIDSFYVMSSAEILRNSSIKEIYRMINSVEQSLIVGHIISELFSDPFSLNITDGIVKFDQPELWGNCVWGMILYVYFIWQEKKCVENDIDKIMFCSRDGYLIKQDYDYWIILKEDQKLTKSDYLYTSRRMGYVSSIKDESSFKEWMEFPYVGTFGDYMKIRFSVEVEENDVLFHKNVELPKDSKKVENWLKKYEVRIRTNIEEEAKNYKNYLEKKIADKNVALMDIGFYGLIQSKIQEVIKIPIKGLYFNNYLAEDNTYWKNTCLIPCFQAISDRMANHSTLRKYSQLIESLFTAPYGMVIAVDAKGNKICAEEGINQNNFKTREQINSGIQRYLSNIYLFEKYMVEDIDQLCIWVDKVLGVLIKDCVLADDIKLGFAFEEDIVKNVEQPIF